MKRAVLYSRSVPARTPWRDGIGSPSERTGVSAPHSDLDPSLNDPSLNDPSPNNPAPGDPNADASNAGDAAAGRVALRVSRTDRNTADAPAEASRAAAAPTRQRQPRRHEQRLLLAVVMALLAALLVQHFAPSPAPITRAALDAAVAHALQRDALPSPALKAYRAIAPSVVRVRTFRDDQDTDQPYAADGDDRLGLGSGVIITDGGIILTNLHVVAGAQRVSVMFADGHESEAAVTAMQPENDLAVLQAATIPDGLIAATLRSTTGLAPGERVIAVGFPFGLGPSASAGIISGLQREFHSGAGRPMLRDLIQFDAAANPGSSGGPLVSSEGEVIGIVTGLLNPTRQGVFIGIGFAVPIERAAAAAGLPPF